VDLITLTRTYNYHCPTLISYAERRETEMANPAITEKSSAPEFINDYSICCDLTLFCIHDSARKKFPWKRLPRAYILYAYIFQPSFHNSVRVHKTSKEVKLL
jgi:hypothetical protein